MKKLIFVLLAAAFLLTACESHAKQTEVMNPGSVNIETFAPFSETQKSEYAPDSAPVYVTVETEATVPTPTAVTSESSSETKAPKTEQTTVVSVISSTEEKSEDDYTIADYESVMYAGAAVNVREFPDAESKRLGHFDAGDEVHITGIVSNGWYRVKFKGGEYFLNGRYLTDVREDPVSDTTTSPEITKAPETTTEDAVITTPVPTTQVSEDDEIFLEEIDNINSEHHYTALNYQTQKAVWFAYLDIDTMLANSTEQSFTQAIRQAFLNVSSMGCNTVYVHVRAFGDAYYHSEIYPFTAAYSGTLGVAPDFDPLEIMVDEAHKLGLSFHAWINPMRTTTKKRYEEMSQDYTLKQWYNSDTANGTYIVYDKESGYYWLSPAYSAVRELICRGIAEIVSNYDVDAIHIDDYFYPTTDKSFDKLAFSVSGSSDLEQWRRDTVSMLVSDIYRTVKSANQSVLFGVSPQGNMKNNKNKLYADIERWCQSDGYLDYIVPQIYYNYGDKLPFDTTALQWRLIVTNPKVKIVCGIAAYKVGSNSEWKQGDILSRQTDYAKNVGYDGCAYYRYGSLFGPEADNSAMKKEFANLLNSVAMY